MSWKQAAADVGKWAVISRVGVTTTAVIAAQLGRAYDSSLEIDHPGNSGLNGWIHRVLGPLAAWDGVYFEEIAANGYGFEQFHAFFPLLPLLMRLTKIWVVRPVLFAVGELVLIAGRGDWAREVASVDDRSGLILGGILVSHASFVVAAVVLYLLSRRVLGDARMSLRAALLFCVSPGGVFFSTVYTESVFAALCFSGLLAWETAWDSGGQLGDGCSVEGSRRRAGTGGGLRDSGPFSAVGLCVGAACMFGLATFARSNGVLLCGFVVFALLGVLADRCASRNAGGSVHLVPDADGSSSERPQFPSIGCRFRADGGSCGMAIAAVVDTAWPILFGTVLLAMILAPFVAFQTYTHLLYCGGAPASLAAVLGDPTHVHVLQPVTDRIAGDIRSFLAYLLDLQSDNLTATLFPRGFGVDVTRPYCTRGLAYSFIQSEYWNVGPLRYWELKQLPNFVLAAPTLLLSLWVVREYVFPRLVAQGKPHVVPAPAAFTATILRLLAPFLRPLGFEPTVSVPASAKSRAAAPLDVLNAAASPRLIPYIVHLAFLALFALISMHVQVSTRLLAAASPVQYWALAALWDRGANARRIITILLVTYAILGTLLFPNFLPWT